MQGSPILSVQFGPTAGLKGSWGEPPSGQSESSRRKSTLLAVPSLLDEKEFLQQMRAGPLDRRFSLFVGLRCMLFHSLRSMAAFPNRVGAQSQSGLLIVAACRYGRFPHHPVRSVSAAKPHRREGQTQDLADAGSDPVCPRIHRRHARVYSVCVQKEGHGLVAVLKGVDIQAGVLIRQRDPVGHL